MSLRTYNLSLARVLASDKFLRVEGLASAVIFDDTDDCALYILAKYSHGLKPHKHHWDLSVGSLVWPAYTAGCLVPGCLAELTVPHPWREANDHDERSKKDLERGKPDRAITLEAVQSASSQDQAGTGSSESAEQGDRGSDGSSGGEGHSDVWPEPAPRAPTGFAIDCWPAVIEDMKARNAFGAKKYGTPLQPFNGRNALVDAYQECLDLCVYLKQRILEDEHGT